MSETTLEPITRPDELTLIAEYDSDDEYEYSYTDFSDEITTLLRAHDIKFLFAKVQCFGWRCSDGMKFFEAKDGKDLLTKALPKTSCTVKLFEGPKPYLFSFQNFHHDSPTGREKYFFRKATEDEVELYVR